MIIMSVFALILMNKDLPEWDSPCLTGFFEPIPCSAYSSARYRSCYITHDWQARTNQSMYAVMGWPVLVLFIYLLVGCCAFDKRKDAMKCVSFVLYLLILGYLALCMAALILSVDTAGKACRGQSYHNGDDESEFFSLRPVTSKYNGEVQHGYGKTTANYLFYLGLIFCIAGYAVLCFGFTSMC